VADPAGERSRRVAGVARADRDVDDRVERLTVYCGQTVGPVAVAGHEPHPVDRRAAGPAGETGDVVALFVGEAGDRAAEEDGAAENEKTHGADDARAWHPPDSPFH